MPWIFIPPQKSEKSFNYNVLNSIPYVFNSGSLRCVIASLAAQGVQ